MDMDWSVLIEAEAPEGAAEAIDEETLERFATELQIHSPAVSATSDTWSARVYASGVSPLAAADGACHVVELAAKEVGLPAWPLVRVEVVTEEVLDRELAVSNFPDILGTAEVTELLGVSRQRLHELRGAGRFPRPIKELASGPLWLRPTVESFLRTWERKPGRPSAKAALEANAEDVKSRIGYSVFADEKLFKQGAGGGDA